MTLVLRVPKENKLFKDLFAGGAEYTGGICIGVDIVWHVEPMFPVTRVGRVNLKK